MKVEVFQHRHWDQMKGTYVVIQRHASRQYIERSGGQAVEGSRLVVDEALLDDEERIILQLTGEEAALLLELKARKDHRGQIIGNKNRQGLDRLVAAGLVTSRALNLSDTEHQLTSLGLLAIEELL